MKNLYAKLLNFQKLTKPILKDQTNPFFKSKFANINNVLEEIKPILSQVGLVVLQPLISTETKLTMKTIIGDTESGEELVSVIDLPLIADPQKQSALITYYRRMALTSLLALQTTDDMDGNDLAVTCQRCERDGKKTVLGDVEIQNSKVSGYHLCSSCLEIWSQNEITKSFKK